MSTGSCRRNPVKRRIGIVEGRLLFIMWLCLPPSATGNRPAAPPVTLERRPARRTTSSHPN
ncbi:hypothetical protein K4B79_29140 [Streptomyces lincolnensis]|uniref:hypothetical protein n=1 Tax=Streptomyces lincolnensis TaxID=1915 RepID=UPI001E58CF3F|nr:hypothetical protein [Streptomyces lincolnensis]MCD7442273.1 hypothetical protein [Streptomyces lincolnensis]